MCASGTGALAISWQVIKAKTKIKRVRATTSAICSAHSSAVSAPPTPARRARWARRRCSTRPGTRWDGSVAIRRVGDSGRVDLLKLTDVAAKTKHMADEYINPAGTTSPRRSRLMRGRSWRVAGMGASPRGRIQIKGE